MMKKIVFSFVFLMLASLAFAKPGASVVVGLGDSYPLDGKNVAEYMTLFASIHAAFEYTVDGGSAAFNPGIGFHIRQNPITLITESFFGSIGIKILNLFDFGVLGLRPYLASDFVFYLPGDSSDSYRSFGYLDFSAGLSISIDVIDIDLAYVTPYDALATSNDFGSALRFTIGYRTGTF